MIILRHTGCLLTACNKRMIVLLWLIFPVFDLSAQEITWQADRQQILIGQPFTCRLSMPVPADDAVFKLTIPDSIPHFELIQAPESKQDAGKQFSREWIFTSFDSGRWVLPAFQVLLNQGGQEKTMFTDSVIVDVMFDPADSTGMPRDIKPVIDLPVKDYTIYFIIGGILIALLLLWLLVRFLKRKKGSGGLMNNSTLSPWEEWLASLNLLQNMPLDSRAGHVHWHAELSDSFRRYVERKTRQSAMSSTTGDLLISLGRAGLGPEGISMAAEALRTGDAVKFARYEPTKEATLAAAEQLRAVAGMIEQLKA